jgi:cation:H+ antiporter
MATQLVLLLAGLAIIIKGGDLFVSAAVRMAELLRLPKVVIGGTLVSLATTTPELVVSIMAGNSGESGLAVGNAIGSCVCNICLILGTTAAIKKIDIHLPALRSALISMFLFGVALFAMTTDLILSKNQGMILIGLGLAYFGYDFFRHSRERKPSLVSEAGAIEAAAIRRIPWFETGWGAGTQFLFAAAIVIVGSKLLVNSAVKIAATLGISSMVIGLTVVAIGTSLPEFITAITSSRKAVSDLAVGNILGANIANLSLIVGTAAAIQEVRMDRAMQLFNFPALLVAMILLLYVLMTDGCVTRRQGGLLLAAYSIYLAVVIGMAISAR